MSQSVNGQKYCHTLGFSTLMIAILYIGAVAWFCYGVSTHPQFQPKRVPRHVNGVRFSDAQGYIDPVIEDPTDGLKQLFYGAAFVLWMPLPHPSYTPIDHLLSAGERQNMQFVWIPCSVAVLDGSDQRIFDDPGLFWAAFDVTLRCSDNGYLIQSLRRNYPRIKYLRIAQHQPLTPADLSELAKYDGLELLYLDCPIAEKCQLIQSVPNSLQHLSMRAPLLLPAMPKLENLSIENTVVTAKFMRSLKAPRLRDLSLVNDTIEKDALASLKDFQDLRSLSLYGSSFDKDNFDYALRLPYLTIAVPECMKRGKFDMPQPALSRCPHSSNMTK